MLTDNNLRSKVDQLWDKLWTGGLPNPMDAIEQLSYLLFLKRMDEAETERERQARLRGQDYKPKLPDEMRWNQWTKLPAAEALRHLKEKIFPNITSLSAEGSSFERYIPHINIIKFPFQNLICPFKCLRRSRRLIKLVMREIPRQMEWN